MYEYIKVRKMTSKLPKKWVPIYTAVKIVTDTEAIFAVTGKSNVETVIYQADEFWSVYEKVEEQNV